MRGGWWAQPLQGAAGQRLVRQSSAAELVLAGRWPVTSSSAEPEAPARPLPLPPARPGRGRGQPDRRAACRAELGVFRSAGGAAGNRNPKTCESDCPSPRTCIIPSGPVLRFPCFQISNLWAFRGPNSQFRRIPVRIAYSDTVSKPLGPKLVQTTPSTPVLWGTSKNLPALGNAWCFFFVFAHCSAFLLFSCQK